MRIRLLKIHEFNIKCKHQYNKKNNVKKDFLTSFLGNFQLQEVFV